MKASGKKLKEFNEKKRIFYVLNKIQLLFLLWFENVATKYPSTINFGQIKSLCKPQHMVTFKKLEFVL